MIESFSPNLTVGGLGGPYTGIVGVFLQWSTIFPALNSFPLSECKVSVERTHKKFFLDGIQQFLTFLFSEGKTIKTSNNNQLHQAHFCAHYLIFHNFSGTLNPSETFQISPGLWSALLHYMSVFCLISVTFRIFSRHCRQRLVIFQQTMSVFLGMSSQTENDFYCVFQKRKFLFVSGCIGVKEQFQQIAFFFIYFSVVLNQWIGLSSWRAFLIFSCFFNMLFEFDWIWGLLVVILSLYSFLYCVVTGMNVRNAVCDL